MAADIFAFLELLVSILHFLLLFLHLFFFFFFFSFEEGVKNGKKTLTFFCYCVFITTILGSCSGSWDQFLSLTSSTTSHVKIQLSLTSIKVQHKYCHPVSWTDGAYISGLIIDLPSPSISLAKHLNTVQLNTKWPEFLFIDCMLFFSFFWHVVLAVYHLHGTDSRRFVWLIHIIKSSAMVQFLTIVNFIRNSGERWLSLV